MLQPGSDTTKTSLTAHQRVADVIVEQLRLWGVQRIYGVVGDAIFGLVDAIARQPAIQFIAVKHESTAAMMASAEAKLTGGLGVCAAQMGPGLGNLINGLGDAYSDQTPVLAITGQVPQRKMGTPYKQYIDQQVLMGALARDSSLLAHPDTCVELLTKAMHISLTEGGVTHLSVPSDLFTMTTIARPWKKTTLISQKTIQRETLQPMIDVMQSAQRPLILVGMGATTESGELEQLAGQWGAGIAVCLAAKGAVPEHSPWMLGGIGEGGNPLALELLSQADVVLLLGRVMWPEGVQQTARIIQVAARSSSIGKGIPVELGIAGQMTAVISSLRAGLNEVTPKESWKRRIEKAKQDWHQQNEEEGKQTGSPLPPSRIVRALEQAVGPDAIMAVDYGDVTLWLKRNFRAERQVFLVSSRWRTMGFGLPAALAAKGCFPDRQVVSVVGDGGLAMTIADLLTATRYQLGITVVLFNNGALQMEQDKMILNGFRLEGVDLTNPDFVKLAEACGWYAERVETDRQLVEVLPHALSSDHPVLLDIDTASIPHPEFRLSH